MVKFSNEAIVGLQHITDPHDIWKAALKILTTARDASIDTKLISQHSKPYWTTELTRLSVELREAKKYLNTDLH